MEEKEKNEIYRYLKLECGDESKKLEDKFFELANYLMNDVWLVVAGKQYKMTELEIYYSDKDSDKKEHVDPYVHCADEQRSVGKWYFNGSGLDITFGEYVYGGILIRGIVERGTKKHINGSSNVLKEIFFNMRDVYTDKGGFCLQVRTPEEKQASEKPIRTVRIGLTKKDDDNEKFYEKEYRYIIDLNLEHKFKDKEAVIKALFSDREKRKEIMGYYIKDV